MLLELNNIQLCRVRGYTILVMPQIAKSHSTFTDPGSLQQHSATQAHQSAAWFIADSAIFVELSYVSAKFRVHNPSETKLWGNC
jgi:hypothetical protein